MTREPFAAREAGLGRWLGMTCFELCLHIDRDVFRRPDQTVDKVGFCHCEPVTDVTGVGPAL